MHDTLTHCQVEYAKHSFLYKHAHVNANQQQTLIGASHSHALSFVAYLHISRTLERKMSMREQVASMNALANVWEAQHRPSTCTYLSEDHASKRILVRAVLVLVRGLQECKSLACVCIHMSIVGLKTCRPLAL